MGPTPRRLRPAPGCPRHTLHPRLRARAGLAHLPRLPRLLAATSRSSARPSACAPFYVLLRAYYEEPLPQAGADATPTTARAGRRGTRGAWWSTSRLSCGAVSTRPRKTTRSELSAAVRARASSSSAWHLLRRAGARGPLRLAPPAHRFELGTDLATAVGRFVTQSRLLLHNPLDPQQGEETQPAPGLRRAGRASDAGPHRPGGRLRLRRPAPCARCAPPTRRRCT